MKKPKDSVFRLIQAMSPSEKRYFKRHYASDQSTLTDLFDFMNGMKEYEEPLIKKHFGKKVAGNLKVYKVQLQDLILKSLTSYNNKRNVRGKIRSGLEQVDILMEKHLYELADDRLSKIKRLCKKFEEYTYLIEISYKEFQLHHVHHDRSGISKLPFFSEIRSYINILDRQSQLSQKGHELMELGRAKNNTCFSEEELNSMRSLLASDLLRNNLGDSFQLKLLRNNLRIFLHTFLENKNEEYRLRKENVELFRLFPQFKKTMGFNYMAVLRNYLNYCSDHEMYDEVIRVIEEAKAFVHDQKNYEVQLVHFYFVELKMYFYRRKYREIRERIEPKIMQHLLKHKVAEDRIAALIYLYFVLSFMALEEHQTAQIYIQQLQKASGSLSFHVQKLAEILGLISHYEAGEDFLVEHTANALLRKYRKAEESSVFYQDILTLIRDIVKKPFEKVERAKEFKAGLHRYQDDLVYQSFSFLALDVWLSGLIARRSYSEEIFLEKPVFVKA